MAEYNGVLWNEFDSTQLQKLIDDEGKSKIITFESAEEKAFFDKFRDINGFRKDPKVVQSNKSQGEIVLAYYELNHGVIQGLRHRIANPPVKDYPKLVATWFRSRWWSVPLVLLFFVLPLVTGYFTLIVEVRDYFLEHFSGTNAKP